MDVLSTAYYGIHKAICLLFLIVRINYSSDTMKLILSFYFYDFKDYADVLVY